MGESVIFIDTFAENWRQLRAEPIRGFCESSLSSDPQAYIKLTGIVFSPGSRGPRARRSRVIRGRCSDPAGDGDGSPTRQHYHRSKPYASRNA